MAENTVPQNKGSDPGSSRPTKSLWLKRSLNKGISAVTQGGKKAKTHDERFSFDVTMEELDAFKEGDCPETTAKNTEWALRNFESWRKARNDKHPRDKCPLDIFTSGTNQEICDWLCKFVSETRKGDGNEYTPRSLYLLLAALQRHMRKIHPLQNVNFFQDPVFRPLKNVCDAIFRRLHSKGIGTETKATSVLTTNEEDELWKEGILSLDNPTGLLNAVFFYNGKNFCLRGGAEHRNLQLSQLKRETMIIDGKDVAYYVYSEFGSNNNQGGVACLNQKNKTVRQYATDSERCHVNILDKYFKMLPPGAEKNDVFYLQPLCNTPANPYAPWFKNVPVGRNKLGSMIKSMCEKAKISGGFTNHSLRAYGATTLFQAKVPEKLIQQRTGHQSLEALRQYERTSFSQLLEVSNIMSGSRGDRKPPTSEPVLVPPAYEEKNQVSSNHPDAIIPKTPTFILNNCTFSGSSVCFSGHTMHQPRSTEEVNEQQIFQETLVLKTFLIK